MLALIGPHYNEATLLPSTLTLAVAALPIVRVLARATAVRVVVAAAAIGIHALTWASGLALYSDLAAQASTRMRMLTSAPPGTVVAVAPYSELRPGFWFFGEDWQTASTRELVARRVFGLADIAIKPPFRTLERNPGGGDRARRGDTPASPERTPDQLAVAQLPAAWPHDPMGVARVELEAFADRLAGGRPPPDALGPAARDRHRPAARRLDRAAPGRRRMDRSRPGDRAEGDPQRSTTPRTASA